jgi:PAS domain S-box-containing protein
VHEVSEAGLPGRFIAVNDVACRHFGYTREELLTMSVLDVVTPEKRTMAPIIGQRLLDVQGATWESRHLTKDGRVVPVEIRNAMFSLRGRRMVLANARDITERLRAMAQLEDALSFARTLLEASPVGMKAFDAQGNCIAVNEAALRIVGGTREQNLAQNYHTMPSWVASGIAPHAERAIRDNCVLTYETQTMTAFGKMIWASVQLVPYTFADQPHLLLVIEDITARRDAEAALTAERERLRVTLRSIGDGVIATDEEGRVVLVNRIGERLTGWTQVEIVGHTLPDVISLLRADTREPLPNPVAHVLATGTPLDGGTDVLLTSRDGTERLVSYSGAPICDSGGRVYGAVLVFRDETGPHLMRQEIQRMAKLDSLATMAGGIAHDFNNLLTGISGNIGLAELMLQAKPDTVQRYLRDAEQATMRARDLTQQLLTFARGGLPLRDTIAVSPVVQEAAALAMTGSQSRCQLEVSPDLWPIHADAGQIHQVLHNLLINADQAMPEGGTILVCAENVTLEPGSRTPLDTGPYVCLRVRDTGVGIPANLLEKIFDPFFTTKQRGSGLGLASVYSIVRSHEGHVSVESIPGAGSTFTVLLPACPATAPAPAADIVAAGDSPAYRILLLDDDAMILQVLTDMLQVAGHTVTAISNGAAAVAAWHAARADGAPYNLAILDLTVPGGLGGADVAAQIRRDDPAMIAIASSGYTTGTVMADYATFGFAGRLAKPYRLQDIQATIRHVMAGREGAH